MYYIGMHPYSLFIVLITDISLYLLQFLVPLLTIISAPLEPLTYLHISCVLASPRIFGFHILEILHKFLLGLQDILIFYFIFFIAVILSAPHRISLLHSMYFCIFVFYVTIM